jgi:hypothetical protein
MPNPFRVKTQFMLGLPGLSLRSNPRLQLANAFGVIANSQPAMVKCANFSSFQESLP